MSDRVRTDRAPGSSSFPRRSSSPTLDALGSALKYHWEVSVANTVVVDGNVYQLLEQVASATAEAAPLANRPSYVSAGGPNGLDCITLQDGARHLDATISVGAANRHGVYVVSSVPAAGGRVPTEFGNAGATVGAIGYRNAGSVVFEGYADLTAGAQTSTVSVPAHDISFHLHAFRPLASGTLYQIDGTTVVTNFTGSGTVKTYNRFSVGYFGSAISGGSFWAAIIVDDASDANDTIIKDYVAHYTGITIA